ncbi:MAG: fumarylacetoacetate hydrolase family protein [Burkholderiales bacterium]|nr:fumarylacetoacetate hydrolase family protein [Burkholderiales bacterium]
MDATHARAAAARLLAHRHATARVGVPQTHAPLPPAGTVLDGALAPATAQDAYDIQDALTAELGPVGGWKVGARGEATPTCAPIWRSLRHDEVSAPVFAGDAVDYECEIAYVFARDLPATGTPYAAPDVLAAIGSTHVGMELLTPRFATPAANPAESLVMLADGLHCGAYILGAPVPGYRAVNCATQPVRVDVNGQTVIDHAGGATVPDLVPLLVWLANHLAARGQPIRAGNVVTTGSWMGKRGALEDGTGAVREVRTRFEGVGELRVRFGTG